LIPSDCRLNITVPRLTEIANRELRTLSLQTQTNAASVLLRVFLELSCDAYWDDVLGVVSKRPDIKPVDRNLALKVEDVLEDLLKRKRLNAQQATPVRRAIIRNSILAPT